MINLNGKWHFIKDEKISLSYEDVIDKYISGTVSTQMDIPSNWENEGLHNFNGAVWFIKKFPIDGTELGRQLKILCFNGVDYFTHVWLNGTYIGHHEGYFQKFTFDVSGITAKENILVVKVTSPREEPGEVWPLKKQLIKGIFNHHDCRPGGWSYEYGQDRNTGGIWNSVELYTEEYAYIEQVKISSRLSADYTSAKIKIEINLNAAEAYNDEAELAIISPSGKKIKKTFKEKIKKGKNALILFTDVDSPEFWNTWDTGKSDLYTLKIAFKKSGNYGTTFGIREVELDGNEIFYLNGKKLFLRGTNIIPEQMLSLLTEEKIKKQVTLMREANINIVRVHAHVTRQEFYEECGRQGILVWQDFPLQWTYDESDAFASNAVRQIKEMVNGLYNHPSIAFWSCHNEPGTQMATLDPDLYNAVSEEDSTRIIRLASNYNEHAYDGWYWGKTEHYAAAPMGPLVTEFGAQGLPAKDSLKKILNTDILFPPDIKAWTYHNFQEEQTFNVAGIEPGNSIEEFTGNSQEYQSVLTKTAVDFYRRKKYNGINGIFQFMFIDCWESISWSIVDYYFMPKKAYYTLREVYQPLYLSVRHRQDKYFPGGKFQLDVWVINDLYKSYNKCKLLFVYEDKVIAEKETGDVDIDSVKLFNYEDFIIPLPQNCKIGGNTLQIILADGNGNVLTENRIEFEVHKRKFV